MALKDWENKGVGNFTNKKNNNFIWIFDKDYSRDYFEVVVFKNPQKAILRKRFKKFPTAEKFAQSYMRSH